MDWRPRLGQATIPTVLVVMVASIYAAMLPVIVLRADYLYSIPIVLGTMFPLAVFASHNPRLFFLVAMIFTAPLGLSINFRGHPHMGGAHAYSLNLMDFFLIPLVFFILRDIFRGTRHRIRLSPISAWWLALILLGMYTMIVGPFREIAAFEVLRMLKIWLLFLVIINECVREKHFHYAIGALAATVAINVAVAVLQYFLKGELGLQALGEASPESTMGANLGTYNALDAVYRPGGLAGHANLLGAYLAMLTPILTGQLFTDHGARIKLLFAVLAACSIVALGLTLSRSSWAAFAVAMGLLTIALFMLPALRRHHLALKAAMLTSIVAGLAIASGPIIKRLTESDPGALDFRFEWVGVAWNMVQDQPVLGFGLNTFVYHLSDYAPYTIPRMYELFGDMWPVVHNTYMLVWSEQGTLGFALFLGLHASILWLAIKNLRYRHLSEKMYMLSLGAALGVIAIMVDGLSSFYLRVASPARVFWIVVALIVAANYWNQRNEALRRALLAGVSEPQPQSPPEPNCGPGPEAAAAPVR